MSAETLRRAAALMRERAKAADTGTRWLLTTPDDEEAPPWTVVSDHEPGHRTWVCKDARHTGEHIASWHPTVALAVALWLDEKAASYEASEEAWTRGAADPRNRWEERDLTVAQNLAHHFMHPLAVARAYLGENASFRPDGGER